MEDKWLEDGSWKCGSCGSTHGSGVQACPKCQRKQYEGHNGSTDVYGVWTCYNSCSACDSERADQEWREKRPKVEAAQAAVYQKLANGDVVHDVALRWFIDRRPWYFRESCAICDYDCDCEHSSCPIYHETGQEADWSLVERDKALLLWGAARALEENLTAPEEEPVIDKAIIGYLDHCKSMVSRPKNSSKAIRRWKGRLRTASWCASCLDRHGKRQPTVGNFIETADGWRLAV